jgi:thymidylate kinase
MLRLTWLAPTPALASATPGGGEDVHVTAEPSGGPIGALRRELTETVTGPTLACLYAADRYHHSRRRTGHRAGAAVVDI